MGQTFTHTVHTGTAVRVQHDDMALVEWELPLLTSLTGQQKRGKISMEQAITMGNPCRAN